MHLNLVNLLGACTSELMENEVYLLLEYCPFGDMKKFYVRKVGAPALYVARERFAPDFGILGFIRFDGVLANTAAIKHLVQA